MIKLQINTLSSLKIGLIDKYLFQSNDTLFFYSEKYLSFIEALTDSKCLIICCYKENVLHGYFPFFIKTTPFGSVVNSSPFYGSHGGPVCDDNEICIYLLDEFNKWLQKSDIVAINVVSSPKNEHYHSLYLDYLKPERLVERVSQMKVLPVCIKDDEYEIEAMLIQSIPSKTRNMIRKALKSEIKVEISNTPESISFLAEIHNRNCSSLGIEAKSNFFFQLLQERFAKGKDYNIYIAQLHGENVAGLLLFYFNKTVEYFIPVIVEQYRSYQPLSAVIFRAMIDSSLRGLRFWNWGGTSNEARGVMHFKNSWGTHNSKYYYYNSVQVLGVLRDIGVHGVQSNFKHFYVCPYQIL